MGQNKGSRGTGGTRQYEGWSWNYADPSFTFSIQNRQKLEIYGNFIWALARKLNSSTEEAEGAPQEIFIDIWQYSERVDKTQFIEEKLIAMIASTD